MTPAFPPQVHVFVRDWLSSNNVLLKSRDGHVLIDSGHTSHAPLTLALIASERGIGDAPLALLVNTHCHSDHVGGNAAIGQRYGCPIAVPAAEAPLVERWDGKDEARTLNYRRGSPAVAVDIDPDHLLRVERRRTNNSWLAHPSGSRAADKWSLRWMMWFQHMLMTYAFFV